MPQFPHWLSSQCTGHGTSEHATDSVRLGQPAPAPIVSWRTVRVRPIVPVPHEAVHADHSLQADTTQSTAHGWLLQLSASSNGGQAAPPFEAGTSTSRARWWDPPPHAAVQLPHGCHAPTVQSTGQGATLHAADSVSAGQAVPPFDASVTTVRECVIAPPPHVAEQGPNASHWETMHETGHACVLHGSCSRRSGHGSPNICAWTTERVRYLKPALHGAVHPDQAVHSDTSQSTGHRP